MVSSQLPGLTKAPMCKPIQTQLLFPMETVDAAASDHLELDFDDVFGPLPVPISVEVNSANFASTEDATELIYDDPVVIHNRSHSLVGPSSFVNQSLKLSKLTISDTEDSVELVECVKGDTIKEFQEPFIDDGVNEKPLEIIDENPMKIESVGIEDFEVLKVVGQGAFAKVYQVRKKGTSEIYAMKVMRKDKIMEKNHAEYMKAERDILTKIDHPFIIQLRYSFQTKYRLYLVLDFVNGGHLFFQLYHHGLFREELGRIYAAEIVSAVAHLHANGIMHRDLKPENILLDSDGHAMLTDFGLAKQLEENTRSNSMCGTVEYMPPEIVLGKGHDKAADWWSVGVLMFEMLTGKPPFTGNRQKIQQKIVLGKGHDKAADWWSVGVLMFEMLTGKPPFTGNRQKIQQKIVKEKIKLPSFLSSEAHSLLKALLHKDPSKRLGSGPLGSDDIKRHKWFKPINWKKLDSRQIQPSFRPEVAGKHCIANFDKCWTDMSVVDSPAASPNAAGNPFTGFSYVRPASSFLQK